MTGTFEWDEAKRRQNLAKHAVDFRRAVQIFAGAVLEIADDRRDYGEVRIRCSGEVDGRVYCLVYTKRGANRRIISAWKANAKDQRAYYARDARRGEAS
jgi:uncharacterized DUF497 family protein